jgi:hypothetical protein
MFLPWNMTDKVVCNEKKNERKKAVCNEAAAAGLPDFSWCMIPKQEKMYQMSTICTYRMVTKYPKYP